MRNKTKRSLGLATVRYRKDNSGLFAEIILVLSPTGKYLERPKRLPRLRTVTIFDVAFRAYGDGGLVRSRNVGRRRRVSGVGREAYVRFGRQPVR